MFNAEVTAALPLSLFLSLYFRVMSRNRRERVSACRRRRHSVHPRGGGGGYLVEKNDVALN